MVWQRGFLYDEQRFEVAKKKQRAPSKSCPECSKSYHPAKKECPHCGAANPAKSGAKPKKTTAPKPSRKTAASTGATLEHVRIAAQLLKQCGNEQTALDAIKEAREIRD